MFVICFSMFIERYSLKSVLSKDYNATRPFSHIGLFYILINKVCEDKHNCYIFDGHHWD